MSNRGARAAVALNTPMRHDAAMRTSRALVTSVLAALLLAGCGGTGAAPSPPPSDADPSAFAVTSPDFVDGGELADSVTANHFNGQCVGTNLNPALEWSGAPEGTQAFAVTMLDASAGDFVHWVHSNIPADATGVPAGGSGELAGVPGHNAVTPEPGYFGPCPPGPDHEYVFTVYALDAPLDVEEGFSFQRFENRSEGHILATASITGLKSGPASSG